MRILWKLSRFDPSIASVRYRCLIPHLHLQKMGYDSHIFKPNQEFDPSLYDAIIFVKTFTPLDLKMAQLAKASGLKVYFDICDNIFFEYPNTSEGSRRNQTLEKHRRIFSQIAPLCSTITCPTKPLSEALARALPPGPTFRILPDVIEGEFTFRNNSFFQKIASAAEAWSFRISSPFRKDSYFLWFGNSGFPHIFGLTDLLEIKRELNQELEKSDSYLVVCSDDKKAFSQLIQPEIPRSVFTQWNNKKTRRLILGAKAVLIPSTKNKFTSGKSNNRALLALSMGTPVIASGSSAFKELEPAILIENWQNNFRRIDKQRQILATSKILDNIIAQYSPMSMAQRWHQILTQSSLKGSPSPLNELTGLKPI